MADQFLGIDCGSVSLNLCLVSSESQEPCSVYVRTRGRPIHAFLSAVDQLFESVQGDAALNGAVVTGSGRDLLATVLGIPAINEITAHAVGAHKINPQIRTIIEIGGQDSKYIRIEPSPHGTIPRIPVFRMNEICAAGTGAFLDEQAQRLGIDVDDFGGIALQSQRPAPIAGRCAVFAKTDMIHQAQEGTPLSDILLGLAFSLVRNYVATLVKGDAVTPLVSLQGGVMANTAVVQAFRTALDLDTEQVLVPPHFKNLGAYGCAVMAAESRFLAERRVGQLRRLAEGAMKNPVVRSRCKPLPRQTVSAPSPPRSVLERNAARPPLIMGIDVGSVSVKGVMMDGDGILLAEDYRLSRSRPLETLSEILKSLGQLGQAPEIIAITGSGRNLAGRLLGADLIVNEISAQCRAAVQCDPDVDTVVEIGGQDSKWIGLNDGRLSDFEMNRVCAAGTGSFLMAQGDRLDLPMGREFSEAAFASSNPADLGCRCTVFMESDLIHHQNNGVATDDLAAGVCISIVRNYLERVANHKRLGKKVLFMGGVAANPAVKAAFEQYTGCEFHVPAHFRVSGALGAALIANDQFQRGQISLATPRTIAWDPHRIRKDQFSCNGCSNQCRIARYRREGSSIYNGGLCERWEVEGATGHKSNESNLFTFRRDLIEAAAEMKHHAHIRWAMIRSPQSYEYFPFWRGFLGELGISLFMASRPDRRQFEDGLRELRVETCLPMKVLSGQIRSVIAAGIDVLFHPSILSQPPRVVGEKPQDYCPYIQASSQFFKGAFPIEWMEPIVNSAIDPDAFRKEHLKFAAELGFSRGRALAAYERGIVELREFNAKIRERGEQLLASLAEDERAMVVLAKPYHTAESFLNMNLGSLLQRLGIKAIPADLYPVNRGGNSSPVTWKYQARLIKTAAEIASDPRLFPLFIGFFGCGPDSFTLRHVREAVRNKPLLCVEMDEHTSRAGLITRIEAFWDRVRSEQSLRKVMPKERNETSRFIERIAHEPGASGLPRGKRTKKPRPERIFLPYWGDHVHAFTAAAMSVGIDAVPLPPPDEMSERLGRPHMVGGECHPFALMLGDYLRLTLGMSEHEADTSRFFVINPDACRLGQFPVYIEKIRRRLGLPLKVIQDIHTGLEEFRISRLTHQRMLLRLWEGLNAYDLLCRLFLEIRPRVTDKAALRLSYDGCCKRLYDGLRTGRIREAVEEALHELSEFPVQDDDPRPLIVVTGDYYTRVVPFANNDVFEEIEANGGTVLAPPTLSDSFKLGTLRDFVWSLLGGRSRVAARHGLLYMLMTILELNVRGSRAARTVVRSPLDLMGIETWRTVTEHAHTKLPAGITAPIATAMRDLEIGADGILNLITLNCSYGTVVTAALMRSLKTRPDLPMLTLVYDGLKKTNEKTRIEAFMEQAHEHMAMRLNKGDDSGKKGNVETCIHGRFSGALL